MLILPINSDIMRRYRSFARIVTCRALSAYTITTIISIFQHFSLIVSSFHLRVSVVWLQSWSYPFAHAYSWVDGNASVRQYCLLIVAKQTFDLIHSVQQTEPPLAEVYWPWMICQKPHSSPFTVSVYSPVSWRASKQRISPLLLWTSGAYLTHQFVCVCVFSSERRRSVDGAAVCAAAVHEISVSGNKESITTLYNTVENYCNCAHLSVRYSLFCSFCNRESWGYI